MSSDDPFKRPFPDENYVPPDQADLRKQALQKAYDIAKTISTDQARPAMAAKPRDWRPIIRVANACLAVGAAAWLIFSPPDWLPRSTPDTRSAEQRALGLRLVLAMEAGRVNAYRESQGQFPETLAAAGGDPRGVRYVLIDAAHYTLTAADGEASATYDSTTPLATLLGGSAP